MLSKKGSVVKNIFGVAVSNVISIVGGIIVGLLLPKVLPVEDYGWYKTFTLYTAYIGFVSLGIIDGIVLKYGGKDYEEINRPLFRSFFSWYTLIHFVFCMLTIIGAMLIKDTNYKFILVSLGVYTIISNYSGYFQQISKITQRFREYTTRKIISSILKIFNVGALFIWAALGFPPTYKVFLIVFITTELLVTAWYVFTYRDIAFGEKLSLSDTRKDIFQLGITGFPLLFANLCSSLILSLDRQFVSILFDTTTYAKYAFAYNMLSLVTVATSAVSTVLYPTLKRTTPETMKKNYGALVGIISIIVFGAIAAYYPLCLFVEWFLPQYNESLPIFRIVFPGLALSSSITVVMHNYYKAEGKNIIYFKKSILVLGISAAANAIAYYAFHTTVSISIASIITMVFWYVYVEWYFIRSYKYDGKKNLAYIGAMMVAFYVSSAITNYYFGFALYAAMFLGITWLLQKSTVVVDLKNMLKK